jgi:integrase/recombinase XerD
MAKKLRLTMKTAMTFEEGVEEFYLDCEARNLRSGTIKHYKDSVRQIYKVVPPTTPINEIDEDTWDMYKVTLRQKAVLNDMSIYTYGRDFKTILRFFMRKGWLPEMELALPKADKAPTETYTEDELRVLLKKPNLKKCGFTEYKCWVMVNFLLSTGVRQNSLVNIRIADIDFATDTIHVNVTKNRTPLIIPMNRDLKRILEEYLKYRQYEDVHDYLFCNEYGFKLVKSTVYHAMYEYNKKRGVQKTGMHRYRHTFAKQWVLMGGNVVSLQKILGHSSLAITQNYLNLLVTDVAKDVEEFNILRQFKSETIKMKNAAR